jgi:hypothetical protein
VSGFVTDDVGGDVGKDELLNVESGWAVKAPVRAVTDADGIRLVIEGLGNDVPLMTAADVKGWEIVFAEAARVGMREEMELEDSAKTAPLCEVVPGLVLSDMPGADNGAPVVVETSPPGAGDVDTVDPEFVENVITLLNSPTRLRLAETMLRAAY